MVADRDSSNSQKNVGLDEARLLDETFDMIKNLTKEIEEVEIAKKNIEADLSKLQIKVLKQEKLKEEKIEEVSNQIVPVKNIRRNYPAEIKKIEEDEFLSIKNQILEEISPILRRIETEAQKSDIFDSVVLAIETEISKLRSELEGREERGEKEIRRKFSELELRINESLKSSEKLGAELLKLEKNDAKKIGVELEKKLSDALEKQSKKFLSLFNNGLSEIENIKKLTNLRDKENARIISVINSLESQREELNKQIEDLKKARDAEAQFVVDKVNEIIDVVNAFEKEQEDRTKAYMSGLEGEVSSLFEKNRLEFEKAFSEHLALFDDSLTKKEADSSEELARQRADFEKRISTLIEQVSGDRERILTEISVAKEDFSKNLGEIMAGSKELSSKLEGVEAEYKTRLDEVMLRADEKLSKLDEISNSHEGVIEQRVNELVASIQEFEDRNTKFFEESIGGLRSRFEEEYSTHMLEFSDFKQKLLKEFKEESSELRSFIEEKFHVSKEQYEERFSEYLSSFDENLKEKEADFLKKLISVEEEKKEFLSEALHAKEEIVSEQREAIARLEEERSRFLEEIKSYRQEISDEHRVYLSQIDEEISSLREVERDFSIKKDEISEELAHVLRDGIEKIKTQAQDSEIHLRELVISEREKSGIRESELIESFNKRVGRLSDLLSKKVSEIENKFLEKQHAIFKEHIASEVKTIRVMEENISSRTEEMNSRLGVIESRFEEFYRGIDVERDRLQEKVEGRITSLEKQLNKRFLDLDSDFSNFKSIVIDEVEDLIREVNTVVERKMQGLDREMLRLGYERAGAEARMEVAGNFETVAMKELREMREELSELRSKVGNSGSSLKGSGMGLVVSQLNDYEQSILQLVSSLKGRGVLDEVILDALLNKGHPRMYVSYILDNYDKIVSEKSIKGRK